MQNKAYNCSEDVVPLLPFIELVLMCWEKIFRLMTSINELHKYYSSTHACPHSGYHTPRWVANEFSLIWTEVQPIL